MSLNLETGSASGHGAGCMCGCNNEDGHDHGNGAPINAEVFETTDAAASSSTSYSIVSDDTFLGEISTNGDEDWVAITVGSSQLLVADLFGFNGSANEINDLEIVDSSGTIIGDEFSSDGNSSVWTFLNTTGSSQTVYMSVADTEDDSTGEYALSAEVLDFIQETTDAESATSNPASLTYTLEEGAVTSASISIAGDLDSYSVTIAAGEVMQVSMVTGFGPSPVGSGNGYLQLFDGDGNLIANETSFDDDFSNLEWYNDTGAEVTYIIQASEYNNTGTGTYAILAEFEIAVPLTEYDVSQAAGQLAYEFWGAQMGYAWGVTAGDASSTISYNIDALDVGGQAFALAAMEAWTMATGIHFVQSVTADLVFDDEDLGNAYASFNLDNMGGTNANGTALIVDASINIGKDWIEDDWTLNDGVDLDSYSFQTYIHEIGHALGLGHAGPYNGSADYTQFEGGDAAFINDSWQMSVMSYFSQTENTFIDATFAYVVTPMLADIQAIHQLYNTAGNIRDTDTIYGVGSTAGGYYDTVLGLANPVTFTVVDDGGVDTIDVSVFGSDQMINLNGNSISSIAGNVGNMSIMDGTEIENVVMGSGDDVIYANDVGNAINGGAGTDIVSYVASDAAVTVNLGTGNANSGYAQGDTLTGIEGVQGSEYGDILIGSSMANLMDGGDGDDSISVGGGDDIVEAGDGNDSVIASAGNDEVNAGEGNDDVYGGVGTDTLNGDDGDDFISGQGQDDILDGGAGEDELLGGSGNDVLSGGADDDTLRGGGNNDTLNGGDGADFMQGQSGSDIMNGGDGDDELYGGNGADTLDGGAGDDRLSGGNDAARDTFVFGVDYDSDRIIGFGQVGTDRIELDDALWLNTHGVLTEQEVVDTFGTMNAGGTALFLNFGNGDILEVQNGAGIDETTLGLDIVIT